jgi:TolA-binding protein
MTGETVTHYRVGEKLGQGGSAVVYRAEDLALGREVVLKFFAHDGAGSIARFQHEARTISSLNHPNICTIYEIGEHGGRHFLAMEMLDGHVLSHEIAGRPLKTDRILNLGTQIAEALDAAHAERIVHRDLKPTNIFVTRSGRIKLLDFGVAVLLPRRADPSTAAARSLSSTGGTIPYMSPEQARIEDLDQRTDLFSLGTVLYEMASGRRPFLGTTAEDVLAAIVNEAPIPLCTINAGVPSELERIITKALEKNPALRYQTASDIRADLQRLTRDLAVANAGPARKTSYVRTSQLRRSLWWASAAVLGASAVAGAGWLAMAAARSRSESAMPGDTAARSVRGVDIELRSQVAASVVEPPRGSLSRVNGRPAAASPVADDLAALGSTVPGAPLPDPAPRAAEAPSAAATPVASEFLVARQQIDLKLYDQAIDTLQKVAQSGRRPQAIDAAFLIASVHDTRGDAANAMSTYIEIANRFPDDARAPEALTRLAEWTLKSKRRDKDLDARRTLTDLVTKYPASSWAPRALLMRAGIEERQGGYQRDEVLGGSVPSAVVTYREIAERYASSEAAATALNKLARIYADTKRFEIAAATFQRLAALDSDDRYDAWFAAGELYEKRLKDVTRAAAAYSRVLPSSPRYAEARRRIARQ